MYNCIKKIGVMILIFGLLFVISSCGKPKAKQSSKAKVQTTTKKTMNLTTQEVSDPKPIILKRTLPSELQAGVFGRQNPFAPLVSAKSSSEVAKNPIVETPLANRFTQTRPYLPVKQERNMPKPKSSLRLTLIIDGNSAVFEENNASKSVSVGDMVAGMKVLEIRKSEVVLGKGDKKYTVMMGPLDISSEE